MKCTLLIAVWLIAESTAMAQSKATFDGSDGLPKGWEVGITGKGAAKWEVVADDTAPSRPNVLKQSGEATFCWAAKTDERIKDGFAEVKFTLKQSGEATYPVCLKSDTALKDGFVEVKFKPISGNEDRAGGVVWRAKDSDNYYIARANALEDNVTIYHTVKGKRTEKKRTGMKVSSGEWHTLRVDFEGNHFTVTFDGKKAIDWDDKTFTEAGMVGVWTKADSVTLFDDFVYGSK